MKLKDGIVLHSFDGEYMAVPTGESAEAFSGVIQNNKTAQFIYQQLLEDTTVDKITDAMYEKYDAPREVIESDVTEVIEQLRSAGILDE